MKHLLVVSAATVAAVLMVGCERAPSIAGPQSNSLSRPSADVFHNTTNTMDFPWADEEDDPCTGDHVTITGTTHFLFVTTDDGSGGFHVVTNDWSSGTGLGAPSLFTYKVKYELLYNSQSVPPGGIIHQHMDLMILGPGSVDNYIKHMDFSVRLDPNGVPTATMDNSFEKCVG